MEYIRVLCLLHLAFTNLATIVLIVCMRPKSYHLSVNEIIGIFLFYENNKYELVLKSFTLNH
jgi:hypothetical protein